MGQSTSGDDKRQGSAAKICVVCKQDCSGKPRTKDEKGRYTCQACYDALMAKAKARGDTGGSGPEKAGAPAPGAAKRHAAGAGVFDSDDDGLDLAGLASAAARAEASAPVIAAPAMMSSCGGCGGMLAPGAVICMNCGYNTQTKKKGKVKITKAEKEKSGTAQAAGAVASELGIMIGWCIGGLVAAGIGIAVWAGVALSTGYESSLVGIGIGALAGIGVAIGGRGNTGVVSGLLAVVAAGIGIWGGHLYAAKELVKRETAGIRAEIVATDDDAVLELADAIVRERVGRGEIVEWPNGGTGAEADSLAEFPPAVVEEARARYEGMSGAERVQLRERLEDRFKQEFDAEVERAGVEFAADSFLPTREGRVSSRMVRGYMKGLLIAAVVAFLFGAGGDIREMVLGS